MFDRNFYRNSESESDIENEDSEMDERDALYDQRAQSQMEWMEGYFDAIDEMESIYNDKGN